LKLFKLTPRRDIKFDKGSLEIYTDHRDGRLIVDYGRLHDTEPVQE